MTPHRILILDRDAAFIEQCTRALTKMGHECQVTDGLEETLQTASRWRPDLILASGRVLDNVGKFSTQARELDPAVQIILVNEWALDETELEQSGADHCICQ